MKKLVKLHSSLTFVEVYERRLHRACLWFLYNHRDVRPLFLSVLESLVFWMTASLL